MNSKLLLLDGATGTELNRRGVDTGLPLWSANALTTDVGLNVLRQVHLDYLNAGADIISTNTFRTNRRVLAGKSFYGPYGTRKRMNAILLPTFCPYGTIFFIYRTTNIAYLRD